MNIRIAGDNQLIVDASKGQFKVFNESNCSALYTYVPVALEALAPERTMTDYGRFQPYRTSTANQLFLLRRDSDDALVLNVLDGSLASRSANSPAPTGLTPLPFMLDGKFVFSSSPAFRVRSIPLTPP